MSVRFTALFALAAALLLGSCIMLDQAAPSGGSSVACPRLEGPWEVEGGSCWPDGEWAAATQEGCTVTFDLVQFAAGAEGTVSREELVFNLAGKDVTYEDCTATFVEGRWDRLSGTCTVTGWAQPTCGFEIVNTDPPEQPVELDQEPLYTAGNDPGLCQQMCNYLASACPSAVPTGVQGCTANCTGSPVRVTADDVVCLQALGNCQDPLHFCDVPCVYDCLCDSGNRVQQGGNFPKYGGCPPADGYCPWLCGGSAPQTVSQ